MSSTNPIEDFRSALRAAGMNYAGDLQADGKLHRFKAEGDTNAASWYVLHLTDNFAAAGYGCWKRNISEKWNNANGNGKQLTNQEWADIKAKMSAAEAARRTEEEQLRYEAKKKAQEILTLATPVEDHLYLSKKSVEPYGEIRINSKNELCLPLRDENGVLHSMQFIAPDKRYTGNRDKDFIFGGRVNGCFYTISDRADGPLVITEGYATGATVFAATGYATVCAMYCGNILPVAQALRKKYPQRNFIFAADNDRFTASNPGVEKATAAAKAVKGALAIPEFSDSDNDGTDFNDLAELSGIKVVKDAIDVAFKDFLMPKFDALPFVDNAFDLSGDDDLIPPEQLINGLLHRGLKMVVGSGSKAFKSWILLDITVSVAGGVPFWMFGTTKGKVLYLNFEIPRWSMKSRIIEVAKKKGVDPSVLKNIDVWSLRGYGTELFKILPDLLKQILYGGYSLVVLDPIYKVLGGRDENAAGDVALMCNELESICVKTGAAVLYAAHFSKGNQADKEAMDRIGGSGVFGRDPDAIVTLTKHEQDDAYTVDTILRNLPKVKPFVMKLDFPIYVQEEGADPESLKRPGAGRPPTFSPDELRAFLRDGEMTTQNWNKKASAELGVSRAQFFRIVKQLETAKLISRNPISGNWRIQEPRDAEDRAPATADQTEMTEAQLALQRQVDQAGEGPSMFDIPPGEQ
jgi:phage/plasmid primase-like uncharacterized protein